MRILLTLLLSAVACFAQITSVTNGLVGWWLPFGIAGSGTNVVDYSGRWSDGTNFNSPIWTNNVTGNTNALFYNGASQYSQMAASTNLAGGYVSISAWTYYVSNALTASNLYGRIFDASYTRLAFYVNQSGTYGFAVGTTGTSADIAAFSSAGSVIRDQWAHLCVTYTSGSASLYTNGAFCASSTLPTGALLANSNLSRIGERADSPGNNRGFTGSIADVRIYNRALTTNEITLLYHEGIPWATLTTVQPFGIGQRISSQ